VAVIGEARSVHAFGADLELAYEPGPWSADLVRDGSWGAVLDD